MFQRKKPPKGGWLGFRRGVARGSVAPDLTGRQFKMNRDKQAGIQIARAVAALSIVYFHSWVSITRFPKDTAYPIPGLSSYGGYAVDLFFAVSGYVICLVISRDSFNLRSFLIKRVFRLYPLWLVMLTAFAASVWLWRGFQPRETLGFFLYSTTLLPTQGFPFYDIGWTLQHEIAFYFVAAMLAPIVGLRGLALFLLASTIVNRLIDLPWYLSYLASRHAEFLAGVLAFMAHDKTERFGFLLPAITGTALLILFAFYDPGLFAVGLFFLIVAFANLNPDQQSWWRKPATSIGDASYSVYLIHPMVFVVASSVVSKFPLAPLWIQEPIRFTCIFATMGISLLSWKYFETPIIRLGNRVAVMRWRPRSAVRGTAMPIPLHQNSDNP
jgi:peptidoglycan/LPS O-acetylase OafA/YrhL